MHASYVIRRALLVIPTVIGVTLFIFVVMRLVPGGIEYTIQGAEQGGTLSREDIQGLRAYYGLDDPIYVQYGRWITQLVRLDLGSSIYYSTPVTELLKARVLPTLNLGVLAVIIAVLIGIPFGVVSAIRQDKWQDYVARLLAIGGLAVPSFWTGIMLVLVLLMFFNTSTPLRYYAPWQDLRANMAMMLLPALVLGTHMSALTSRMTRSALLEVMREDYIRTARSKGLGEGVVLRRHALRNALLPVVTIVGLYVAHIAGGSVIVENIFNIPGMGSLLIWAVYHRDYPVIEAELLVIAMAVAGTNLLVDLVYGWLDPRIRYG